MAKSTFGSSFAQTFQQSLAAARKAEDEEKADKRFNERLAEQRAYNTMEDTKKEARILGVPEKELATYQGAENQHALNLLMDDLRTQNEEGRLFAQGGGELQPQDSLLGDTSGQSSAYMSGFKKEQARQANLNANFQAETNRMMGRNEQVDQEAESNLVFKAAANADPSLPFDFGGDWRKQLKNVEDQKAFDIRGAAAGLGALFGASNKTVEAPTAEQYGSLARAEQKSNIDLIGEQATARTTATNIATSKIENELLNKAAFKRFAVLPGSEQAKVQAIIKASGGEGIAEGDFFTGAMQQYEGEKKSLQAEALANAQSTRQAREADRRARDAQSLKEETEYKENSAKIIKIFSNLMGRPLKVMKGGLIDPGDYDDFMREYQESKQTSMNDDGGTTTTTRWEKIKLPEAVGGRGAGVGGGAPFGPPRKTASGATVRELPRK